MGGTGESPSGRQRHAHSKNSFSLVEAPFPFRPASRWTAQASGLCHPLLFVFCRCASVGGFNFQFAAGEVRVKGCEARDGFLGETEVVGVQFDTEGLVAHGFGGSDGGAGTRSQAAKNKVTQLSTTTSTTKAA